MTAPTLPDRDARPGGRWSSPDLLDEVLRLALVERAVAHVTAGWIAKIPELDNKLAVARTLEGSIERASALRQQALVLLERDEAGLVTSPVCIDPLQVLDERDDPSAVVEGILVGAPSFLLERYRDLASRLDPLYDARLLRIVRSAVDALAFDDEAEDGQDRQGHGASLRTALNAAWSDDGGEILPLDEALWRPLDRVHVPARPAGRPRPEPGQRLLRTVSRLDPVDLAGELNENVLAELCAMELLSRSSYEHPEMPWSFHLAMARHAADEERHASIFRRMLAENGFDEGNMPQHGANYEYAYEFPECEVGGPHELVWRLLVMCTVLEALAIDKLPLEIGSRDWLGQFEFARALDYIATDEMLHTENGLRWVRTLCKEQQLDPILERELVHGRFFGRQEKVRADYLAADPERAAWEIEIMVGPDPDGVPFGSRTEVDRRLRASFTEFECEQAERWGYNIRVQPAPVDASSGT
jgi:hypothetical protein